MAAQFITLSRLLTEALDKDDFEALCFQTFRPVYDQFTDGMTRGARARLLLDYVERQRLTADLLREVRDLNNTRYEEFTESLAITLLAQLTAAPGARSDGNPLWPALQPLVAGQPRLRLALEDLAQAPGDADLQLILRTQVRRQALADEALDGVALLFDDVSEKKRVESLRRYLPPALVDRVRDLDAAQAFAPPHLSVYHLTLEPNTVFANRPPVLPDDDTASAMLDLIVERTGAAPLRSSHAAGSTPHPPRTVGMERVGTVAGPAGSTAHRHGPKRCSTCRCRARHLRCRHVLSAAAGGRDGGCHRRGNRGGTRAHR